MEHLAIPDYHGKENGVGMLNAGYLQRCGYHMNSSDNVVTCYNEIISGHWKIQDGWHNPVTNTWGPQVDHILLKSFKLFPFLESTATEDVVNFYNRFYKLLTSHLFAIMPFDAIILKHHFEGLCIPGLGTRRYADMSQALMDFLPWLIPGTLSSCINATLAAVRCKTNNGYDYLWHILELTVPDFDPIIPILTPQWHEFKNIFYFAQSYLLFFCLQSKMHYHYMDRVRSSMFLWAIQNSDYADMVRTLQSQVNSYREDYDTGFLPPHLCLHGLAESIHSNAQACLQDVISPRIHRINYCHSMVQGLPPATLYSPSINRLGRLDHPEWNGVGFRDNDCDGNGGSYSRGLR